MRDYTDINQEDFNKDIGKKNYIEFDDENTTFKVIPRSETIGRILKYLRGRTGYKQTELASKIGIAQQTYAGYETGKHEPSTEILIRLADVYGVSLDYITGRYLCLDNGIDILVETKEILELTIEQNIAHLQSEREFIKMIRKEKKKKKHPVATSK